VDAQSFPFSSTSSPTLIDGAYSPSSIYTLDQVEKVIEFANQRGVRVILEFDMPGFQPSFFNPFFHPSSFNYQAMLTVGG